MSETVQPTLATIETDPAEPDATAEQSGEDIVSQILGISKAEVQALANELDSALGPILAAHGDTIVICSRLGGAEMSLSQAVIAIWPPSVTGAMLIEGLPSVLAEIEGMLANRVEKTEEEGEAEEALEQEEEKPKKEEPVREKKTDDKTEIKSQKIQENPQIAEAEKQSTEQINHPKPADLPVNQKGKTTLTEVANPVSANAAVNRAKSGPEQAGQAGARTGITESSPNEPLDAATEAQAPASVNAQPETAAQTVADRVNEIAPASEIPETQLGEISVTEVSQGVFEEIDTETAEGVIEFDEEAAEYEIPIQQTGAFDSGGFKDEEEILVSHLEPGLVASGEPLFGQLSTEVDEGYLDPAEIPVYQLGDSAGILEQAEAAEQPARLAAPIQEIKDSLTQLTDRIETSEPEVAEIANEILDKIIEVPARLESIDSEEAITEAQAQEELEVLFTELFETLGIDYTPELIESLVRSVIQKAAWEEELMALVKEPAHKRPQDAGTHEAITQLLTGYGADDKVAEHAGIIGKSVLELCNSLVKNT